MKNKARVERKTFRRTMLQVQRDNIRAKRAIRPTREEQKRHQQGRQILIDAGLIGIPRQ